MFVPSEHTSLLEPQIGFKGSAPMQPVSGRYALVNAHRIMVMDVRRRKEFITLRAAYTPMPEGGYNVVTLRGGRQQYFRQARSNAHAPWVYRMANGLRDCYVVWGRPNDGKIFPVNQSARARSSHGAIYTMWPIIDEHGALTGYGWEVRVFRFQVLDKTPEKGDLMILELVHRKHGLSDGDMDPIPYGADEFIRRLVTQAKEGFVATCDQGFDSATAEWRTWFLDQRQQAAASGSYGHMYVWRGWLEELDKITDAWQLTPVLAHYRDMFPERPPQESEEHLRRVLSKDPHAGPLAVPEYEGTDGSREARLLNEYYRLRPGRRELFERWVTDFVALTNRYRSYTGD